ncbi:MAG: ABC transporter permease, partial [Chloroflexi bacterium]
MATISSSRAASRAAPWRVRLWAGFQGLLVPLLSVITAILLGSILILLDGRDPVTAFEGLFEGAFLEPRGLLASFRNMVPLVLSGLAVAFAFKSGLFNIGVQGQLIVGSVAAAWIGFAVEGLPPLLHITLALAVSVLAGGLWAAIAGALKAYADAHEVITTIMLNYIAVQFAGWLISTGSDGSKPGPLASPAAVQDAIARTPEILDSAKLPVVYSVPPNFDLHIGIFIAIIMALLIMFLLYRTTFGFQLRMNGYSPSAAEYAGVSVERVTILTMFIAGALAGLAGGIQTLGVN